MTELNLELWSNHENGVYYKWPFYDMGVSMQPAAALTDVLKNFDSLLFEKESAGRVLARLIDQGKKAGLTVHLDIADPEGALAALPQNHRLKAAVSSMSLNGAIRSSSDPAAVQYNKERLRRLFGLN